MVYLVSSLGFYDGFACKIKLSVWLGSGLDVVNAEKKSSVKG